MFGVSLSVVIALMLELLVFVCLLSWQNLHSLWKHRFNSNVTGL